MPARIWLHIGTEKTGTTSIQAFLQANRVALADRGFVYPTTPGAANHTGLTAYAQDDATIDDLRIVRGVRTAAEVPALRAQMAAGLQAEAAAAPADAALVMSGEHCSSRLRSRAEIERLHALCGQLAPHTTVVVYLRNQVDFLASFYSTTVKSGNTDPLPRPVGAAVRRMMDYHAILQDWAAVFGAGNIVVRRFVAEDFPGGDLIADLCATIGADGTGLVRPDRRNRALDTTCLAFLRDFNRHVPRFVDRKPNPLRGQIVQVMERLSTGPTFVIPPDYAAEITASYAKGNAAIARDFLGNRPGPLFPAPSAVGDAAPDAPPEPATYARLAAELWKVQTQRIRKLEERQATG